jgi:hypothetical protein
MDLILYKTTDASNVIGKTLTDQLEININLKRSEDQEKPRLLLKNDGNKYTGYNYAYIDLFKRYYFVESINNNGKIIELQLETDVLETYKDDILNAKASIASYYPDNTVTDVRKRKDVYTSDVTLPDDETMILVTTGSGGANK